MHSLGKLPTEVKQATHITQQPHAGARRYAGLARQFQGPMVVQPSRSRIAPLVINTALSSVSARKRIGVVQL